MISKFWRFFHKKNPGETETERVLREKYKAFVSILAENEHALDLIAELENKYYNTQLTSIPYLRNVTKNLSRSIQCMVENLLLLSSGRHKKLMKIYKDLDDKIREIVTGQKKPLYTPIVIPMSASSKEMIDKIGSKMANLGELRNSLGISVPDGFSATACASQQFLDYNNLTSKIAGILMDLDVMDSSQLMRAEEDLKAMFMDAQVPPELAYEIQKEIEKIEHKHKKSLHWAIRSSAIGEDMENSFAGQFSTILDVKSDDVLEKYKEVLASKYNAHAITYRRMKHIWDEDLMMSVGFVEMIYPQSSGVLYTMNPMHPEKNEMIVNAIWGFGQLLVEGLALTDAYVLHRGPGFPVKHREVAEKGCCFIGSKEGKRHHDLISTRQSDAPCLNEHQLRELAAVAMTIEEHFRCPQDIEWCFNDQGQLFILQARPLHVFKRVERPVLKDSIKATIITKDTRPVSPGVGTGKVFKLREIHDLQKFPKGGVLVTKHSSPRLVRVMHQVSAIIAEQGSATDHMASLVKEFKIPCVIRVPSIFSLVENGQEVTVDATSGIVYQGKVAELLSGQESEIEETPTEVKNTESYRLLHELSQFVMPLHLTDPRSEKFSLDFCKTYHDILRFSHEAALNEMFASGEKGATKKAKNIYRVETSLPFQMYILDLLGDVVPEKDKKIIQPHMVSSIPFQAIWKGITHPNVSWAGPSIDISLRDMATAISRASISLYDIKGIDTRSYAVVTKEYLNLNMSMGFHFVVLDCYLSKQPYNNYISLSFKGGAAEAKKRRLRIIFIKKILEQLGFYVHMENDFLQARIKAEACELFVDKLDIIGRILGVTRLLDVAMNSEKVVNEAVERFFQQDYSLGIIPKTHRTSVTTVLQK